VAAVTSVKDGCGFGKLALLVSAVAICRPFAVFSVTDKFLRFSLIRAMKNSPLVHVGLNGETSWQELRIESAAECFARTAECSERFA
jgi:hypothetical protein